MWGEESRGGNENNVQNDPLEPKCNSSLLFFTRKHNES